MGGMVLETNMSEIMLRIEEQNKIEKEEVRLKDKNALKTCLKMYKWVLKFSFLWSSIKGYPEVRNVW